MWKSFWHNVGVILLTLACAVGAVAALMLVGMCFFMGVTFFVLAESWMKWVALIVGIMVIVFALAFYYAWRERKE
jgi:membrane protein implicated in regulation of membrane protease activity